MGFNCGTAVVGIDCRMNPSKWFNLLSVFALRICSSVRVRLRIFVIRLGYSRIHCLLLCHWFYCVVIEILTNNIYSHAHSTCLTLTMYIIPFRVHICNECLFFLFANSAGFTFAYGVSNLNNTYKIDDFFVIDNSVNCMDLLVIMHVSLLKSWKDFIFL